ncbi:hypothetical protein BDV96DRAFT_351105 [Lophiotrema nucula]|uniref:Uncharacterized protein n=1 Tax=Lophiotrema nucula TaxID=690887 RepID=A0A6A5ZKL9_9PLEO|nr:hypothetical protein BDV96DRAFT_351105 [Lophiotrema nucula]
MDFFPQVQHWISDDTCALLLDCRQAVKGRHCARDFSRPAQVNIFTLSSREWHLSSGPEPRMFRCTEKVCPCVAYIQEQYSNERSDSGNRIRPLLPSFPCQAASCVVLDLIRRQQRIVSAIQGSSYQEAVIQRPPSSNYRHVSDSIFTLPAR